MNQRGDIVETCPTWNMETNSSIRCTVRVQSIYAKLPLFDGRSQLKSVEEFILWQENTTL